MIYREGGARSRGLERLSMPSQSYSFNYSLQRLLICMLTLDNDITVAFHGSAGTSPYARMCTEQLVTYSDDGSGGNENFKGKWRGVNSAMHR